MDGDGDASSCKASEPTPSTAVRIAVTTYVQNREGSLSRWSRDNQATDGPCGGRVASQSVRALVFPKPAGAASTVSAAPDAPLSRCVRRGRGTAPRPGPGRRYLLRRSVVTTDALPHVSGRSDADCLTCCPRHPFELPSPAASRLC